MNTIKLSELRKVLTAVKSCIQARPKLPVLGMIAIESDGESIRFTGTDLDKRISVSIPVKAGIFNKLIEARLLSQSLKGKGSQDVEFSDSSINIGALKIKYSEMGVEEFPTYIKGKGRQSIAGIAAIANLIRVSRCSSKDETRYIMNSVFIGRGATVATDARRLIEIADKKLNKKEVIIPLESVKALQRMKRMLPESVTIRSNDNTMSIASGNVEFHSKIIDGTYPNYQQVIPANTNNYTEWKIGNKEEVLNFLDTCSNISNDPSIMICFEGDTVTITERKNGLKAEMKNQEITYPEGLEPFKCSAFNPKFLYQLVEDSDSVLIRDELSVAYGKAADGDARHLLMPLRLI